MRCFLLGHDVLEGGRFILYLRLPAPGGCQVWRVFLSSHILFRWSVLCVLCGVSLNLWVNQIVVVCGKIVLAGLVRPDSGGMVLCMICLRRFASLRSAALVLARLPRWRVLGRCVSSVFCCGAMS